MISEILRDPVWQFAGAVVSIVAIVVSLWIARAQCQNKRMSYFSRSTQLLSVDAKIRDNIQILYEGSPVRDVQLKEFGIKSIGTVPVVPNDFVKPIEFFFGVHAHILSAKVASTQPHDLGAEIRWGGDGTDFVDVTRVRIQPLLLNPGDSITVQCLVTGSEESEVTSRIAGVKALELEQRDHSKARESLILLLGLLGGVLVNISTHIIKDSFLAGGKVWLPLLSLSAFFLVALVLIGMRLRRDS